MDEFGGGFDYGCGMDYGGAGMDFGGGSAGGTYVDLGNGRGMTIYDENQQQTETSDGCEEIQPESYEGSCTVEDEDETVSIEDEDGVKIKVPKFKAKRFQPKPAGLSKQAPSKPVFTTYNYAKPTPARSVGYAPKPTPTVRAYTTMPGEQSQEQETSFGCCVMIAITVFILIAGGIAGMAVMMYYITQD